MSWKQQHFERRAREIGAEEAGEGRAYLNTDELEDGSPYSLDHIWRCLSKARIEHGIWNNRLEMVRHRLVNIGSVPDGLAEREAQRGEELRKWYLEIVQEYADIIGAVSMPDANHQVLGWQEEHGFLSALWSLYRRGPRTTAFVLPAASHLHHLHSWVSSSPFGSFIRRVKQVPGLRRAAAQPERTPAPPRFVRLPLRSPDRGRARSAGSSASRRSRAGARRRAAARSASPRSSRKHGEDHGQNRKRAVRRGRRRVQGSEPALHVGSCDLGDRTAAEPRQDLLAQVYAIDRQSPRLPHARIVTKGLLGDRLEIRLSAAGRRDVGVNVNRNGGHECFSRTLQADGASG